MLTKIIGKFSAYVEGYRAKTESGTFDLKLSKTSSVDKDETNPEEIFAAGYAACFFASMQYAASKNNLMFPEEGKVTSTLGYGFLKEGGFGFDIDLNISLPGLSQKDAQFLIDEAHHKICPYSNAIRNNVRVGIVLV